MNILPTTLKRVAILSPSGNTTAIVFDQLLPTQNKELLNAAIMTAWKNTRPNQPAIEQCCFITTPNNPSSVARMEMFGGEFCANAVRGTVWMMANYQDATGTIESSGTDQPIRFSVNANTIRVDIPLPPNGIQPKQVREGTLVQLDGITHLVITDKEQSSRQILTKLLESNAYNLGRQPAVGVSYYDRVTKKAQFCVWVKAIDTMFDETACGSGTAAIGIAEAAKTATTMTLPIIQPCGELIQTTALYANNRVTESTISGTVTLLYDGPLELAV